MSVVTAHRMVVSLSTDETSLWDQIEYSGAPADFVWVLPITSGSTTEVAVGEESFFQYLSSRTEVSLLGPATSTGSGVGCGSTELSSPRSTMVRVYSSAVVGPYETVTIGSDDPTSLGEWLSTNGYAVPDAVRPVIAYYVERGMDFVVLRLAPNASVSQMQPVRVTTAGLNVTFPLRMVAAGVSDSVAIELYVIAGGRWEAANFPNAVVSANAIIYDWATGTYNYDELATARLRSNGGRTWLTEFSDVVGPPEEGAFVTHDETGYHGPLEDWEIATRSLSGPATVTRMRAELPASALSDDLALRASAGAPLLGVVDVTHDRNAPLSALPAAGERGSPPADLWVVLLAIALALAPSLRRRMTRRAPSRGYAGRTPARSPSASLSGTLVGGATGPDSRSTGRDHHTRERSRSSPGSSRGC